jgi:hypothetical protein
MGARPGSYGLALVLPEQNVMARPTGFGRADTHSRFRIIPIEGADIWETAARNSA